MMKRTRRIWPTIFTVIAALGLLVPVGKAFAQETIPFDDAFVQVALAGDAYEILSSELALERSENEDVRAFAQQMIDAHTSSSEQLTAWAGEQGIDAPFETGPAHGILLQQLHRLEGEAFDSQYLLQQRAVHRMALMQHQIAVDMLEDEQLRDLALQNVDAIAQHLMQVESVMSGLGIEDPHDQVMEARPDAEAEEAAPAEEAPAEEAPADEEAPAEEEAPADEAPEDAGGEDAGSEDTGGE